MPSTATGKISSTIPILPALDMHATISFYTDKLGFTLISDYGNYALISRDGAEVHFFACDDKHLAENSGCYIRVKNIEQLFEELNKTDAPQAYGLELKPWGMKEFALFDNNGNLLRFGELP